MKRWRRAVIITGIIVGVVWFLIRCFTPIIGLGVDARSANAHIHQRFELPVGATDVNYWSTVDCSRIDFKISRNAFLEWARHMNWSTIEVKETDGRFYEWAVSDGAEPRMIKSGLVFPPEYGNEPVFFSGVFDDDIGRASVTYATR